MLVERGRGRRAGGVVWGHFQGIWKNKLHLCFQITPEPEKPPWWGLVPISPAPSDGRNAPKRGGVAGPIWETSWDMGYLGISPFPCSQLVPDPPKFYLKQRVSPPKSREKQQAKLPPACPSLISRHVFRFAFSKALSAPGAAEGAWAGGSTAPIPPPQTATSQDSTVQTPPFPPPRPIPTDVEKYKNPKTSAII